MSIVRAILQAFDGASFTATVQVVGSRQRHLSGVPVSRAIPAAQMVAGRQCALLFYDQQNPADALVLGVY